MSDNVSDNVMLFPNILQLATALKAYAPIGVKFWESQETALEGWKEFADRWFSGRRERAQAALEAGKILAIPTRHPISSGNIRTGSRERWNCLPRMARLISNKC